MASQRGTRTGSGATTGAQIPVSDVGDTEVSPGYLQWSHKRLRGRARPSLQSRVRAGGHAGSAAASCGWAQPGPIEGQGPPTEASAVLVAPDIPDTQVHSPLLRGSAGVGELPVTWGSQDPSSCRERRVNSYNHSRGRGESGAADITHTHLCRLNSRTQPHAPTRDKQDQPRGCRAWG